MGKLPVTQRFLHDLAAEIVKSSSGYIGFSTRFHKRVSGHRCKGKTPARLTGLKEEKDYVFHTRIIKQLSLGLLMEPVVYKYLTENGYVFEEHTLDLEKETILKTASKQSTFFVLYVIELFSQRQREEQAPIEPTNFLPDSETQDDENSSSLIVPEFS
jgi:hypothetical protein